MSDEWMDMKQCAAELGVVPITVRRLLVKDGVPVLKIGKWQVKRSEFERFLARRTN
jgi:hypothetical protein